MMNRLQATLACDVRLQFRNGFYYAAAVVAVLFVLLLTALPAQNLTRMLPALIVNNIIVNGFYFMGGLVLLEKGEGSLEAQTVTPLRSGEYLAAKVATLTLLSLLENALIVAITQGPGFEPSILILGIGLGTALYALAGFAIVARYDAINEYLLPSLLYVTALALPLLPYFGIGQSPVVEALLYLHPLQPILLLLGAALQPVSPWVIAYGTLAGFLWVGIFYRLANRAFHQFVIGKEGVHRIDASQQRTRWTLRPPFRVPGMWRRMGSLTFLQALGSIDAKSVQRDALLRWMALVPLVAALAIRWLLPPLVAAVETWLTLDLGALYPDLMGYLSLLLVPYLWGVVTGFLLLDQRDDGTLVALQVTPLSPATYLAYRLLLPTLMSTLMTLVVLPLTGLAPLPLHSLILLAVSAAPLAPLFALALAALAQNKVQGMALMKVAGIVLFPPLVAFFLPAAWQWPFALAPTYWPARIFWHVRAGGSASMFYPSMFYLIVGLLYQLALLAWLARRFDKVMHR